MTSPLRLAFYGRLSTTDKQDRRCASSACRRSSPPSAARPGALTGKQAAGRIRQQLAESDRRIKAQVRALEEGIEPDLVAARIAELRQDRDALQAALDELSPADLDEREDDLAVRLGRVPDLTQSYRDAAPEIQRQTRDAFDVRILVDKAAGRIGISGTISDQIAAALENEKTLREEGLIVTITEVAGAGFEPATFGL